MNQGGITMAIVTESFYIPSKVDGLQLSDYDNGTGLRTDWYCTNIARYV